MKDTDYTFAVARIRANEVKLLTENDMQALMNAKSYEEAVNRLNEHGYKIEGTGYNEALLAKEQETQALIFELLPDKSQFNSIFLYHDFANLKVMLKALITQKDMGNRWATPSLYDPEEIKTAVYERKNSALPEMLAHADRSGYRILTKTGFAQLADAVIDRAAMEHSISAARKADNAVMLKLAEEKVAVTDIKILYRCMRAQKAESFMKRSMAQTSLFCIDDAVKAAVEGEQALAAFFSGTKYASVADSFSENTSVFEKKCDDVIMQLLKAEKWNTFGIAPLVGYYFGVLTEVKNLRILLSGKLNGQSAQVLSERMREPYV